MVTPKDKLNSANCYLILTVQADIMYFKRIMEVPLGLSRRAIRSGWGTCLSQKGFLPFEKPRSRYAVMSK